jgi:hypothetical protein
MKLTAQLQHPQPAGISARLTMMLGWSCLKVRAAA